LSNPWKLIIGKDIKKFSNILFYLL
jgi:hypothetical protein